MIKKIFVDILMISAIVGLLFTKFIDISIMNARPDLILILVLFIGMFDAGFHPIIFGFLAGLTVDFISGASLLGFNALLYTILGYVTIIPYKIFKTDSPFSALIVLLLFFIVKIIVFMILAYIFVNVDYIARYLHTILLGELVYSLVVSIPIFYILEKIYKLNEELKKYG